MTEHKIPRGWRKAPLKELFDVKNGKTDVVDAVKDGLYPLYDRSEEVKKSNKYLFDCEAVILPGEGKDFAPKYYHGKFDLHQRAYALYTSSNQVNVKFFYYAIHNLRKTLRLHAVGSTVKSLRLPIIQNLELLVPSKLEQDKIAEILTIIDENIEETDNIIGDCECIKKGLMQTLFTNGLPGKHKKFKNAEIGGIPEEWEIVTLGGAVSFLDGKRVPIKEQDRANMKGQYPYYGASGVIDYVNDYIFDENLILLGEDGENILSRNLPLVFKISGKVWVNNHAHVLKPNIDFDIDFLTQYLESINYQKYNTGTAQPKLNQEVCRNIPIIKPTYEEQHKIANILISFDIRIEHEREKRINLELLKKSLMQKLLSGEIRVKV
jgi:type I restriction enzyme, S subunit